MSLSLYLCFDCLIIQRAQNGSTAMVSFSQDAVAQRSRSGCAHAPTPAVDAQW